MYAREPRKQAGAPEPRTAATTPAPAIRPGAPRDLLALQRSAGNAAVVQLMKATGAPATSVPVARVMDEEKFKEQTSGSGLRSRSAITAVDKALRAFHALRDPSPEEQIAALGGIVDACLVYLARKPNGPRSDGVERLRQEANVERGTLVLGPKAPILSEGEQRFRDVLAQIDAGLELVRQHEFAAEAFNLRNLPQDAQRESQGLDPAQFHQMMLHYIGELGGLLDDDDLPDETRTVIQEVVGVADRVTTMRYPAGTIGTSVNHPAPDDLADTEYTFNVDTQARGGTPFMLGHIAHELTHVAAHQAFNSSSVMALAPIDTPGDEIAQLARERAQTMDALLALLRADDTFHPDQRTLLEEKLNYGKEAGKLARYAATFRARGRISEDEETRLREWDAAAGVNSGTLVEYDTVLNQMLVYLHLWRIDQADAFYVRLRAAAAEATDRRLAALQAA
ncbi:hypothetical protein LN042_09080 [Kitasatospora sp. RB6PN24]|uniref:hypothetical protein n=1 Tax=Kitasatospora humi TaxID=2893891 RepID=UPI001E5ABF5D|nr:hypothetical protein [Kitasatospora humi]MCC9307253.1 hypothetical protein [Kitasatospora humi]